MGLEMRPKPPSQAGSTTGTVEHRSIIEPVRLALRRVGADEAKYIQAVRARTLASRKKLSWLSSTRVAYATPEPAASIKTSDPRCPVQLLYFMQECTHIDHKDNVITCADISPTKVRLFNTDPALCAQG